MLQDVIEKKHDETVCQSNWKNNGRIFNQDSNTCQACQYFNNCLHYSNLLVHDMRYKSVEIKHDQGGIDRLASFRIHLALYQEVKDDVMLGCRLSQDLVLTVTYISKIQEL